MIMTTTTDLETRNAAPRQDNQDFALFGQTPSQTVGPYFHYGLPWKSGADLVGVSEMGARPDLMPPEHYLLGTSGVTGAPQARSSRSPAVSMTVMARPFPTR
jgi:protocatechuate 3,4-dioxygenase alpha subunit